MGVGVGVLGRVGAGIGVLEVFDAELKNGAAGVQNTVPAAPSESHPGFGGWGSQGPPQAKMRVKKPVVL